MVFFKRLSRSRSRSNSQSYVDNNYDSRHDSKTYDDQGYAHSEPPRDRAIVAGDDYDRPPASAHSEKGPRLGDGFAKETSGGDMYSRRDRPVEVANQQAGNAFASGGYRENLSDRTRAASNGYDAPQAAKSDAAAPNLLIEAFNQAVRPYSDKIEGLESEIADLRAYIASLERQQNEVHAWIDKRGLRPGECEKVLVPLLMAFARGFRCETTATQLNGACQDYRNLQCTLKANIASQTFLPRSHRSWTQRHTHPRPPTRLPR